MIRPNVDSQQQIGETAAPSRQFSFDQRLREISRFFDGRDSVNEAMRTVVSIFNQNNIEYAIVGGMAVNAHRHRRTTGDVDFLVRPDGLDAIRELASRGIFRSVVGPMRVDPRSTFVPFWGDFRIDPVDLSNVHGNSAVTEYQPSDATLEIRHPLLL